MTTNFSDKKIEDVIQNGMMGYASYVLLDRCLPSLEDGLKPVYRRILYSMHLQKATKLTKSANVAGQIMRLHPHGSTYGTMVGMVQKDRHAVPMLEGKGNFSQYTSRDLAPAADRYSEIKLSEISIDMMQNFDKNVVKFIDNYDGTIKMPEVLPVKFPAILAYAQSGIGVGFSSSTASFNLIELCDSIIKYIETDERTVLVPDFATGGLIIKEDDVFNQINFEGRGTVKLRGKAEIEGNEILITEIPYSTTREAIIEKIIELNKAGKLKEVTDITDQTGLKGMLISVTTRRGTDMQMLLEKLYRFTPLQSTYSSNMNILVDNLPRVLGVWPIIDRWLEWRVGCIQRGLTYDIEKMSKQLHLLRGLEKVLLDIDRAIELIRSSDEDQIISNLCTFFNIDEVQAEDVANMKLRNINKEYIIKKIKDIEKFSKTIESYEQILEDDSKLNQIIIKGLQDTKEKFGRPRQSKIIKLTNVQPIRLVEEVPNYQVTVHLTKEGYCYKFRGEQQPTLKPGDSVFKVFETDNKSEILVFGEDRVCYKIPVKDIDETRVTNLGTYLPNMIRVDKINIVSYSILDGKHKFIMAVYSNNRISKINLEAFEGTRSILRNSYCLKQDLVDMITLQVDVKLKITTDKKKLTVNTKDYSLTLGRNATGVYINPDRELKKVEVA